MAAAIAAASMFFFPTSASAETRDVLAALQNAGIPVSKLNVIQTEGITILRGQVTRREYSERVAEVIRGMGYQRVANMLTVVPLPEDEALVLEAERKLSLTRSLDGCRLKVDVDNGALHLTGTVDAELQKDLAVSVLEQIEGVRSVSATLTRS